MASAQTTAGEQPPQVGLSPESPSRAAAHVQRPLRRYPDRGLLGGVCAGVASHFGVDVFVVRLLTAMLIVVGGIGVAVYALAWALIPVAPESEGAARPHGAWREA